MSNKKYLQILVFSLISISSLKIFANNLIVINELNYPHKSLSKSHLSLQKNQLKRVILEVNNKQKETLLSEHPNQTAQAASSFLKKGDHYKVKVQTVDGKWYHTKKILYKANYDSSVLSINGNYLPYDLRLNGKEISHFYNSADWPSFTMNVSAFAAGDAGLIYYYYSNSSTFYAMDDGAPGGGSLFGFGEFGGTAYLNTAYINSNLSERYKSYLTEAIVYSHVQIDNDKGVMIGYGNAGGVSAPSYFAGQGALFIKVQTNSKNCLGDEQQILTEVKKDGSINAPHCSFSGSLDNIHDIKENGSACTATDGNRNFKWQLHNWGNTLEC